MSATSDSTWDDHCRAIQAEIERMHQSGPCARLLYEQCGELYSADERRGLPCQCRYCRASEGKL